MSRYIAFLRGINLGKRRLPMSRLKALFEDLDLDDVATFIASGNVLFSTGSRKVASLENRIAEHLKVSLGYPVDTFIRTDHEVKKIAHRKVFPEDGQEGITIHVGFFHKPLSNEVAEALAAVRTDTDEFRVDGREYYWLCRVRTSDSTVWKLPEVKALSFPTSTMRNLTTVRKLVAKHLHP